MTCQQTTALASRQCKTEEGHRPPDGPRRFRSPTNGVGGRASGKRKRPEQNALSEHRPVERQREADHVGERKHQRDLGHEWRRIAPPRTRLVAILKEALPHRTLRPSPAGESRNDKSDARIPTPGLGRFFVRRYKSLRRTTSYSSAAGRTRHNTSQLLPWGEKCQFYAERRSLWLNITRSRDDVSGQRHSNEGRPAPRRDSQLSAERR